MNHLKSAKKTIKIEAKGLEILAKSLGKDFNTLCDKLLNTKGKIITLGIGKSGHIAKKVSATLSSTGSPSAFVNAGEALHGDAGSIGRNDKVLIFSHSTIAKNSYLSLDTGIADEACPLDLAPTTSTTAALALGDAIAVALLEAKNFSREDFAKSHPGGKLGKRLITKVNDLMTKGKDLPKVSPKTTLSKTLIEVSKKGLGVALVIEEGNLKGIFTDGDLRRALNSVKDPLESPISKFMSEKIKIIPNDSLAIEALEIMQEHKIYSLAVVNSKQVPEGVIRMHDLIEAGLV